MSLEYYGEPRPAGDYYAPVSSSSQEDDSSYGSGPSTQHYFATYSSYKNESLYPDFLTHPRSEGGKSVKGEAEKVMERRQRILSDLDSDTLKAILELVRSEDTILEGEKESLGLEEAIREELENRANGEEAGASKPFVIDWNGQFQRLLDSPDSIEKFAQLRHLANDFCFTAELYARVIISELYLPTSQKTIKPSSLGGVAGGQKFVVQGILFKFAVDVELRRGSTAPSTATSPLPSSPSDAPTMSNSPSVSSTRIDSVWMYGGTLPATENAMKAAKHELRSTIAYFSTNACRVPLVALVDFRGYRVLCSSILPIDSTTICYGSSDAGKTMHCDSDAARLFAMAAKKLNLKSHRFKGHEIHAPVDVEGHHGHDGQMYCIDLARLFPPEAPTLALQHHPRAMFYRLLRPELVRLLPNPLSSDSFTNFGVDSSVEHNAEVEMATKHLQTNLVPNFAKSLSGMGSAVNSFASLVSQTHKNGINLRYLGLIRNCVVLPQTTHTPRRIYIPAVAPNDYLSLSRSLESDGYHTSASLRDSEERHQSRSEEMMLTLNESAASSGSETLRNSKSSPAIINPYAAEEAIRQLLLEEMIARVLKCMLRAQWRKRMQEVRICTETPFATVFLDLINIVAHKYSHSQHFWTVQIKEELKAKYTVGLTAQELDPSYDLSHSIELRSLLERFVAFVGVNITLTPDILSTKKRPFLYTDIHSISSTTHHMNIIDYAEGCLLALTARKREKTLKLQLLSMAEKKLTSAHSSGTSISISVVFELANVHYEKAMLLPLQECTVNVIEAIRCYTSTLQLVTSSTNPSLIGKCHIRLLRLFFEKIGGNVLLQESALQAQGILELHIAKHLDGALELRPRALKKLLVKISQLPEPEPAMNLISSYLPDCCPITSFSNLLTCLVHSSEATRSFAAEIFQATTCLNIQFCPQLLDPLNSGFMIGTKKKMWKWESLTEIDLTSCISANAEVLSQLLSSCPSLSTLVLNQCYALDNSLATVLCAAPCVSSKTPTLSRLELSLTAVSDSFFSQLDKADLVLSRLTHLNLRQCANVTDVTLKILATTSKETLEAIFIDLCPKIEDVRPIRKFKRLHTLGMAETKATEPRLKEVLAKLVPQLRYVDVSFTAIIDKTFDWIEEGTSFGNMLSVNVRKTAITKATLAKFSSCFPNMDTLIISSCELDHGFGKFVNYKNLKRLESSLNKWTSGCDIALVTLKNVEAPVSHLNVRSCWNTVTDPVLLMCVRSFASMTSLNISVCTSLSNAAMEAVSHLSQLRFLSLSGNRQLVDSALIRIARALGSSLVGLEIAHCKQISTMGLESVSKHCTNLRYIDISFIESFRRIHSLGIHCLKLETVKTIGLSGCAAESFQKLFNRGISLRRVNFKSCPVTNEAVISLGYASRFISELCLADCSAVDDTGISRLFQLCRYIQKLDLTSVTVTDAAFESGKKSLASLRHLNLSGCNKLSDKTITILQKHCPLLEYLNCSACALVTGGALTGLINAASKLMLVAIKFCPRISEETIAAALSPRKGTIAQ